MALPDVAVKHEVKDEPDNAKKQANDENDHERMVDLSDGFLHPVWSHDYFSPGNYLGNYRGN